MAPQITIDITDAQQAALDNHNAAFNAKHPGSAKASRQSFAEAAFTAALDAATKAPKKANRKD